MNDGAGDKITLTLLQNNDTVLWSSSCSGASCTIEDTLNESDLMCDELSLQLDGAGNATALNAPAFVNVTLNGVAVVFDGTSTEGIQNKMLKFVTIGHYRFTCDDVPLMASGKATVASKLDKAAVEVHFMNADAEDEISLSLLKQDSTILWSGTCSDTECGIAASLLLNDLACEDLSVLLEIAGNATLLNAPAFLNVTFNDASAIFEGTPQYGGGIQNQNAEVHRGRYLQLHLC